MEHTTEEELAQLKNNQHIITLFGVINMYFIVSDIYNLRLSLSFFLAALCIYFLGKASIKIDNKIKDLQTKL